MKRIIILSFALIILSGLKAQQFDVDTISMTGPLNERINFVFLSDGYREEELDKFIDDVNWMIDALFAKDPYPSYRDYFNCFAIKVPSEESGAADDPSARINNYFGSSFNSSGIWRLVVPGYSGKVQSVLQDNCPQYDQVVMLVNDSRYGGSGGWIATSTTHADGPEICIHELGHSFGGLSDEYWAGAQYARENINMTQETDREKVRWKNWLDFSSAGIYSHDESPDWKRPHQNCEMRYLKRQFCPVCQEAITDKILDLTNPVISYSPEEDDFEVTGRETEFSLNLLKPIPNTLNIRWTLNTDSLAGNVDTLNVSSSDLLPENNRLVAFILDTTAFIRNAMHSRIHLHKVIWNFYNSSTGIQIADVSEQKYRFEIFPNPASDHVSISWDSPEGTRLSLSIISPDGREILISPEKTRPAGRSSEKIYFNKYRLSNGLYHLIFNIDGQKIIRPLVIEK